MSAKKKKIAPTQIAMQRSAPTEKKSRAQRKKLTPIEKNHNSAQCEGSNLAPLTSGLTALISPVEIPVILFNMAAEPSTWATIQGPTSPEVEEAAAWAPKDKYGRGLL